MQFIVSRTYATETSESAEHGDFAEHGYVYENNELSFRQLIDELRECTHLSCSGPIVSEGAWAHTWACMEAYLDPRTGNTTEEAVHIHKINGRRPTAHQLRRIFAAAGLLERRGC